MSSTPESETDSENTFTITLESRFGDEETYEQATNATHNHDGSKTIHYISEYDGEQTETTYGMDWKIVEVTC